MFAAGLLLAFVAGCAGKPPSQVLSRSRAARPVGLVQEKEISGMILGETLREPRGLAVNARGEVYLVDAGNHRLLRFDRDLNAQRAVGGHGSREGLFDEPRYVTVDRDFTVWLTDEGNRRLCRYSDRLVFLDGLDLYYDDDPNLIRKPNGVGVTDFGEAWISDRDNNRVALLDNIGRYSETVGDFGYPGGRLREPAKIVTDRNDNMYVCDAGNGRIVVYDDDGGFVREIGDERLISPLAAAFDPTGGLWVLDAAAGRLYSVRDGRITTNGIGPMVGGSLQPLKGPADIAFLTEDRILIADTGHDRLLLCRILFEAGE